MDRYLLEGIIYDLGEELDEYDSSSAIHKIVSTVIKSFKKIISLSKKDNINDIIHIITAIMIVTRQYGQILRQANLYIPIEQSNKALYIYFNTYVKYLKIYKEMISTNKTLRNKIANFMELLDTIMNSREVSSEPKFNSVIKPHFIKLNRMLLYLLNYIDNKGKSSSNTSELLHYLKDIITSIKEFKQHRLLNFVITHFVNIEALKIFTTYNNLLSKSKKVKSHHKSHSIPKNSISSISSSRKTKSY